MPNPRPRKIKGDPIEWDWECRVVFRACYDLLKRKKDNLEKQQHAHTTHPTHICFSSSELIELIPELVVGPWKNQKPKKNNTQKTFDRPNYELRRILSGLINSKWLRYCPEKDHELARGRQYHYTPVNWNNFFERSYITKMSMETETLSKGKSECVVLDKDSSIHADLLKILSEKSVKEYLENIMPWVRSRLNKYIEELLNIEKNEIQNILRDYTNSLSHSVDNAKKKMESTEKFTLSLLSHSQSFNHDFNDRCCRINPNHPKEERLKTLNTLVGLLIHDGHLEKVFLERHSKQLDDYMKIKILSGEFNSLSSQILNQYREIVMKSKGNEWDVRYHIWWADIFHIYDQYDLSLLWFDKAEKIAKENNINMKELLLDQRISRGHILLHLNQLNQAKEEFENSISDPSSHPILQAMDRFRLGEVLVYQGDNTEAIIEFYKSMKICEEFLKDPIHSPMVFQIIADDLRKMGTTYRMMNELETAREHYKQSGEIYKAHGFRGRIWLIHGLAELKRSEKDFPEAIRLYKEAREASEIACNSNRITHADLGLNEIRRMQGKAKFEDYLPNLVDYMDITSNWGIVNVRISQAIIELISGQQGNAIEHLEEAKALSQEMGLKPELECIKRIEDGNIDELHPLTLF